MIIEKFLAEAEVAIAEFFVGSPMFLYGAGFETSAMVPFHNPLGLGNLEQATSAGTPAPKTTTQFIPVSTRFPHGAVRLEMERQANPEESIGFGVVLSTLPTWLKTFRIMVTCSIPSGPHSALDTWAVVVQACDASAFTTDNRDRKIIATLQSAWNAPTPATGRPGARMNHPLPTSFAPPGSGTGPWLPQDIFDLLFPGVTPPWVSPTAPDTEPVPLVAEPVFTLQLDVDRAAASGHCTLFVKAPGSGYIVDPGPGYALAHVQGRDFVHPFMRPLDANGQPNAISAAGVNLAITGTGGDGPVSVVVEDFLIFGTGDPGLLGMLADASFWPSPVKQAFREARSRLTDWSFAHAARRMAKSRLRQDR